MRASSTGEARDRIRIVIADDHDLYRRGMQAVIGLEPDLEIVAEAGSGAEAVENAGDALDEAITNIQRGVAEWYDFD